MSGETIKAELEALSEVRYALLGLKEQLEETAQEAEQTVQEEAERLEAIQQERTEEFERCKEAYENCRSVTDEDGNRSPCTGEAAAKEAAKQALDEINNQIKSFTDQSESLLAKIKQLQHSADSSILEARSYLEKHIHGVLGYLRNQNIALPSTPGQDPHGPEYQRARRRFYQEGASGDFENEPAHLHGWMRQEVNRGGYYHSPSGYDVGHWIRNLNIPENYRFEFSTMNRAHGGHIANRPNLAS